LISLKVDAIGCAVDNSMKLVDSGSVAKSLLVEAGKQFVADCRKFPAGIRYNEVVSISGGNLKCNKVFLTSLPDFKFEDKTEKINPIEVCMKILFKSIIYQSLKLLLNHCNFIKSLHLFFI